MKVYVLVGAEMYGEGAHSWIMAVYNNKEMADLAKTCFEGIILAWKLLHPFPGSEEEGFIYTNEFQQLKKQLAEKLGGHEVYCWDCVEFRIEEFEIVKI